MVVAEPPVVTLAVLLRQLRTEAGLTQEELAAAAQLSPRSISDLERGVARTARKETARLLAAALNLGEAARASFEAIARGRVPAEGFPALGAHAEPNATPAPPDHPHRPRETPVHAAGLVMPVPQQLPAAARHFSGRVAELGMLANLMHETAGGGGAVVISVISGTAGVGKTALAVHWAHQVADHYPDGHLYVNLRGFGPDRQVMEPAEAVREFLDAFQVPAQRIPAGLDAQVGLYRSLLAGRRMLIVLDNARDSVQARPLLPGAPGCLVLATSRNQLTGLVADGAHPIPLDVFTPGESHDLLARRLGPSRVAAEPQAADEIITRCAGLPQALAIVAARAAAHPTFPMHTLATELRDSRGLSPPSADADPATDLRAVFSWSYLALTPAARRLFRLLGLHAGPDISAAAAASLAGLSPARMGPLLDEVADANLIAEHSPGRYDFHDLLRGYAVEQAHLTDPPGERHAAIHRVLDHYLHTACTAARLLNPHRDPITLTPPQPGVTPEEPADHGQALDWFTRERAVLLAAVDSAVSTGLDTHTWQLSWALVDFLYRQGHWHDQAATQRMALAAAERQGEFQAQAGAHRYLARACAQLDRFEDADAQLHAALDLFRQAGDQTGQADTHLGLAWVWERQGGYAKAFDHSRQALDLHRAAGHRQGQADALNAVGWYCALLGDHQRALTYCEQALTLHQQLDDRQGQAATWDSLGCAHHYLRHHAEAITCYQHALDLYRDLGDRYGDAETLTRLGDTHHATGNPDATRDAWQRALTILEELGHPDAEHVRAKLTTL